MINPSKYIISKASPMRKFVTSLDKSGAILPVVLLEATVTGGRTYQAYKRDGFVEARERVTEESLGAVFWLFGATLFGKLFDKIGQKFMKIPKNMPDVGVDAVRMPFDNFINKVCSALKLDASKREVVKKNLARFSVGKTALSLVTACLFIGYVVPKVNQAITKHLFGKMNKKDPNHDKAPNPYTNKLTIKDARSIFSAKDISINAVENFKARKGTGLYLDAIQQASQPIKNATQANKNVAFKGGADSLLRIVQNFEHNPIWKLLGTDVGTVSGRTLNARNNDERVEIMFRDISSIYFYCFSMPHIVAFMNKRDAMGGLNTKLNPMSAMEVHNGLVTKMKEKGLGVVETVDSMGNKVRDLDGKIKVDTFKEFALGKDLDEKLFEKIVGPKQAPTTKKVFFGLFTKTQNPEPRVIKLSEFEAKIDAFAKPEEREKLKALGRKMSELMQPARNGERLITETQIEDVLRGGEVRQPEFMSNIINNIFKDKNCAKPLTSSTKFIEQKAIDSRRQQILDYVEAIVKDGTRTGEVSAERMLELNKRNMRKNGLFMGLAMGVSALFLSTIIPKIQYYITYLRTGKKTFPGTENMTENK